MKYQVLSIAASWAEAKSIQNRVVGDEGVIIELAVDETYRSLFVVARLLEDGDEEKCEMLMEPGYAELLGETIFDLLREAEAQG